MNIGFDLHNNAEPKNIFLGTPDRKIVCAFNSIKEETVDLRLNLNNACELTFRMDKYIDIDGQLVEANGYDIVDTFSRIYVEDIGWFICDTPKTENDGYFETKEIMAESIEMEFMQHDLVGLKVNHGTTDSLEMLAENNVTIDEVGIEFAREQIKFYNPNNPELSLMDLVLRESELREWKIGFVDNSPKIYRNYVDGEIVETMTNLHDEIGFFQIDSKTVYSFLTQDVATYFECMVLFDINNLTINVYRVETLGEDTGINIGFRNLEKSNLIEVTSPKSVFTRLRVAGGNGLGITFVNFGSNMIENIDYFLNTKFMPLETVNKYKAWYKDMSEKRLEFISLSRQHNAKIELISELTNRVPLDDTSRDWSTFTLEDLENRLLDFQAQQRGIETFFIDDNGDLDSVRLRNSSLWKDYTQIVNYIIPNIEIAIANKQAERQDEIQDFIPVKDWSLYGLSELQMRIRKFEGERDIYIRNGFNMPWHEGNGNSRDMHNFNHQKYVDVTNMLDSNFRGSAAEALMLRQEEIDLAESERETLASKRRGLMYSVQKENWTHDDFEPFTEEELYLLHNALYNDTDYINENMFLVSSDTTVTAVDEQLKLLDVAEKELVAISQPQYRYDTTLDNFLAMHDYKDFTKQLILGNFINLGVRDDYYVKLRLISISFNPLTMDNEINIEFSNMVRNASGRNDFASLLESANSAAKNQIFGSTGGTGRNEDNLSVRALMNRMIQTMEFNSAVGNAVNREVGGVLGSMLRLQELEAQMIRVTNIVGENSFFQYLQAQLIAADQIIANSGDFKELLARVANIGTLLAGEVVAELGHIIRLTSRNVVIEEAVIKELIAANILVADLKAGDISTNSMNLVSDDGGLKIVGNTMQFHDSDGNLRIQIGRDSTDNFSFTLFDAEGKGVLIDQDGIRESAISDGLIRGDMISNNTISRDKLNFNIVEGDENGNLDASKVVINGNGIDAEFTRIRNSITTIQSEIENGVVGRDGMSVGHNLLLDSGNYREDKETRWVSGNQLIKTLHNGFIHWIRTTAGTGNGWMRLPLALPLERGEQYTVSVRLKRSRSGSVSFMIFENGVGRDNGNTTAIGVGATSSANEWTTVTGTFTVPTNQTWTIRGFGFGSNVLGVERDDWMEVAWIMLVEGNEPKVWQPNPNDILTKIETSFTGVSSRIDAVESSIENRIWRDDIITIEDEDGNELEQTIHSLLTQHQMRVGNIQTQISSLGSRMEDGMQEIIMNMSSLLEQTAEMIASSVSDNITGENSYVNQMANEIFQQLANAQNDLSILSQTATELTSRITNNEDDLTEVKQTANLLMQRLTTTENDIKTIVTQSISAAEGWKVHMARIGAYEGNDVPDGTLSTTMRIREDGVTINSNDSRQAVRLTGREVAGYFNFDGQHGLLSRNLLVTSGNFQAGTSIKWYARHPNDFSVTVHDGFVRITKHSAVTPSRWIIMPLVDSLVPNNRYSYSFKWRRNRSCNDGFIVSFTNKFFANNARSQDGIGRNIPANTWNVFRHTQRISNAGWTYMMIPSVGLTQVGDTLDIEYFMFNEGNAVYPPWEPAPEKIFGIDEDIVYSNRLLVDNGIDLVNQKVIPITYSQVKGLAFVKSGGTS